MRIRETLNDKPGVTTAVTAGIIVLALIYVVYSVWPRSASVQITPQQAYFTGDLGKTYQPKPAGTLYALDGQGNANNIRAWVFHWPGEDQPFVAFLERVSPEVARQHNAAAEGDQPIDPMSQLMAEQQVTGHFVATPGEDRWYAKDSPQGAKISQYPSRDGKYAVPVDPD